MLRAREDFFIYSLAAGLAPAWLGESTLFSLSPHHPTTPAAGCLAALLVMRSAALQPAAGCLPALLVITGAWLLLCRFIAALGYQNICILGGFGIMKT